MRCSNKSKRSPNRWRPVFSLLVIAALLNACTLQKAMELKSYEDFAEVSNSIWANLYFIFKEPTMPNYGRVIYKDTTWKKKDGDLLLDQNVFILPGVTLTMEPGVVVRMGEKVKVTCRGLIRALGNEAAPVVITWKDEGRPWDTIECLNATNGNRDDSGAIEFRHTIVEHGKGIRINASKMVITDSVFRHHGASAMQIEYASGLIADNEVYDNSTANISDSGNGAGIKVFTNGSVRVENNRVHDNVSAGGRDGGGGIYAFAYDGGDVLVSGNTVTKNRSDRKGGGIFAYEALVKDNIVRDNVSAMTGGGIYVLQAVAQNNEVSGNRSAEGGGIFSKDAEVIHNLIINNEAPKGSGIFHLATGTIAENSFAGNQGDATDIEAVITMLGSAEVRHNNIIAKRGYALHYLSHSLSPDLNARQNYWGTGNESIIEKVIYDWLEDSEVGLVDWKEYVTGPIAGAPPLPGDMPPVEMPVMEPPAPGVVRGAIEADAVWGDGVVSDYTVVGNLLIGEGCTLSISRGTAIAVKEGVSIRVRGRLMAYGEEKRPVVLTSFPGERWDLLFFENRSLDESRQPGGADGKSSLTHCTIENGGGILMDGQGADLSQCLIRNHKGSGIRIKEVSVAIKGCTIRDNVSDGDGGGIYAYGSQPVQIHHNAVVNNRAKDGGGIFSYGYQSNMAVDMRNNRIEGNTSLGDGGGVWASRSAVVENHIMGNHTRGRGGGIFATFALVNDNHILNNMASEGGGAYGEANNRFIGNSITRNISVEGLGGGAYLNYWGLSRDNKVFSNNRVHDNKTADGKGTGGICLNGDIDFMRNAIFGNSGFQLNNLTPASIGPIKAPDCYWRTRNLERIEGLIQDGKDDDALSIVDIEPVARNPEVTERRDPATEETP